MTDIEDLVREEFDTILYKKGIPPSSLHLPQTSNMPYCSDVTNKDYKFREKPIEVYPKGYRKICDNCLMIWRAEHDF